MHQDRPARRRLTGRSRAPGRKLGQDAAALASRGRADAGRGCRGRGGRGAAGALRGRPRLLALCVLAPC
jgi:hypothetical protein